MSQCSKSMYAKKVSVTESLTQGLGPAEHSRHRREELPEVSSTQLGAEPSEGRDRLWWPVAAEGREGWAVLCRCDFGRLGLRQDTRKAALGKLSAARCRSGQGASACPDESQGCTCRGLRGSTQPQSLGVGFLPLDWKSHSETQ